jgi:hypothetical protein
VRNLPGAARTALGPVVTGAQAGLDLQEDLEHGRIGLGDAFELPEMTCGHRVVRAKSNTVGGGLSLVIEPTPRRKG